jgi:hypothetical protein
MENWKLALSVGMLATAAIAGPQEVRHAPSFQQCIGDINLWSSQLPGFPETSLDQLRSGTKPLTAVELEGREQSMAECVSAYPVLGRGQPDHLPAAITLTSYYDDEIQQRYVRFLDSLTLVHCHQYIRRIMTEIFMPKENVAPFCDVHIQGISKEVLAEVFKGTPESVYEEWNTLTCWRKLKNDDPQATQMIRDYVFRFLPPAMHSEFNNPISFFEKRFAQTLYERPVAFLRR